VFVRILRKSQQDLHLCNNPTSSKLPHGRLQKPCYRISQMHEAHIYRLVPINTTEVNILCKIAPKSASVLWFTRSKPPYGCSQDRCHRIGQTREVHIYRLVSINTVEENILRKSDQKRHLDWLAIGSGGFTPDALSRILPADLLPPSGASGSAALGGECQNGSSCVCVGHAAVAGR
jgi:hypothetical protein